MKVLVIAALLAGSLACSSERREHIVIMHAMTFDPPTLTVASGDRVVWRNDDIVAHTATAVDRFDSGEVAPGKSFTITLSKAGEVKYACRLHPTMLGALEVK